MKAVILILILLTQAVCAEEIKLRVVSAVKNAKFELGVGSQVALEFTNRNERHELMFLGKMVGHPHFDEELLFLNPRTGLISLIDSRSVRSSSVAKSRMQSLISPVDQAGETCAAYALYHFWVQTALSGYTGNGELLTTVQKEHSRLKLLEESITRYYMGRSASIRPVMNHFGSRFGFKCREKIFDQPSKAIDFIFAQTSLGRQVVMEFFIGPNMVESSYRLKDFETKTDFDPRLWTPRKVGERNVGGHAIVASAAFLHNGKKQVVVLDSNWNEPRVWDLEKYLGGKTALKEMVFHSCE